MASESLVTIPPQEDTDQEQGSESTSDQSQRPEWLPEKYWDNDKSVAKVRELSDNLVATQTALRNRKEEMRQEIEDELKAGRPAAPDEYKLDPNAWEVPEGSVKIVEADPLVGKVRQWAHKHGVQQEAFNELLGSYAQNMVAQLPDPAKETAALGEKAQDRLNRLGSLAGKALKSDEELEAFRQMSMRANQIQVLEKLIDFTKGANPQGFTPSEPSLEETNEELNRIMSSDAYWNRDIATISKAQRLQERLAKYRRTA